jgi:hypothetical protein
MIELENPLMTYPEVDCGGEIFVQSHLTTPDEGIIGHAETDQVSGIIRLRDADESYEGGVQEGANPSTKRPFGLSDLLTPHMQYTD